MTDLELSLHSKLKELDTYLHTYLSSHIQNAEVIKNIRDLKAERELILNDLEQFKEVI